MNGFIEVMDLDAMNRDITMNGDAEEYEFVKLIDPHDVSEISFVKVNNAGFDEYLTIKANGETYIVGDSLWLQRDLIGCAPGLDHNDTRAMYYNRFKRDAAQELFRLMHTVNYGGLAVALTTCDVKEAMWMLFKRNHRQYGVSDEVVE